MRQQGVKKFLYVFFLYRLIDLDLIERKKIMSSDRIHYEYEIIDSALLDYL